MSPKNDFKAFSISDNANVVSQEKYEENQGLQTGFPPDNVPTHVLNKVLRQASTVSSVVADFIAAQSGNDVLDDGNIAKLTDQLNKALEQKITTDIPSASLTQKGVVQLTNVMGNSDTLAVTQKLVQEVINALRADITIPVGSPIPWPLPNPPTGYFICNGSAFNSLQYPQLAEAYPSGRLPDLRGEFIRGWDDGRGVDLGRALLTWQESTSLAEYLGHFPRGGGQQIVNYDGIASSAAGYLKYNVTSPTTTGVNFLRFRPRNVAFNYIVRAA
ncbi:tail fiber protein [Photorhabdus sp. RW14-46]|uniref:tail fiber protein n=1 Tax=Photorhabdus sp. RW14-46 TaxID=2100168 RepID=UPI0013F3EAD3|nr:tail fiber protein [Photorhabdus sp. RW14-46]NHB61086.1 DNA-packaging protein [Photorhabdus sp. RW14-46]